MHNCTESIWNGTINIFRRQKAPLMYSKQGNISTEQAIPIANGLLMQFDSAGWERDIIITVKNTHIVVTQPYNAGLCLVKARFIHYRCDCSATVLHMQGNAPHCLSMNHQQNSKWDITHTNRHITIQGCDDN